MKVSDRRRGSPVSVSRLVISRTHEGLRPLEDVDVLKPKTYFMYCTTSFNFQKLCVPPTVHLMCFAWVSEQTAIIFLYRIKLSVFITEAECLLRGTNWVFQSDTASSLKG